MIQQHCYTRERRGLFRNSDGYDSIARSKGLEDAFIKDFLHPFCFYHPSKALQAAGTDARLYPRNLTLVHFPDGRMLFGQTAYVGADFTGQRSTFFVHNYVFSPEEKSNFLLSLSNPSAANRLLLETGFQIAYDVDKGKEIPELSELPVNLVTDGAGFLPAVSGRVMLERLCIDKTVFMQIVHCLLQSVAGTKKVYIIPPVGPEEIPAYARSLIIILYRCLPPALLRLLGFCTYSREPENKKFLHLMFLENVMRPGDPRVSRDFLFDLANGYFGNVEPSPEKSPFLQFVWERAQNDRPMDGYYRFCETFPTDFSIRHWDDITDIYHVYKNIDIMETYNTAQKTRIFECLKRYLPACTVNLSVFAANLVLNEAKAVANTEYLSERCVIESIAGYYAFDMPKQLVSQMMFRYLLKNENDSFFVVDLIRSTDAAFLAEFVDLLLTKESMRLLDGYLHEKTLSLPLSALFEEMRFWIAYVPPVYHYKTFEDCVLERVGTVMAETRDIITTANLAYKAVQEFETEYKTVIASVSPERFIRGILDSIDGSLLSGLDFDQLTLQQLNALPDRFIQRGKSNENAVPFLLLDILKKITAGFKAAQDGGTVINIRYFVGSYHLRADDHEYLMHKLREFACEHIKPEQYENIVFLFRSVKKAKLEAEALLRYIDEAGGEQKGSFLVWAADKRVFNLQNESHSEANKQFIKNNIKNSAFKAVIYENAELKTLAREVRFGKLAGML